MEQEQQENYYDFPITPKQGFDANSLMFILSPEDIIESIRHTFRNEYFDSNSNSWIRRKNSKGEPEPQIVNDYGIAKITAFLSPINKSLALSDLHKDEIKNFATKMAHDIIYHLAVNYEDYDIDPNDLDFIFDEIIFHIYPALKRAESGNTLRAITKIQHSIERRDIGQEKKRSILSSLNFFGARGGND